ncbi:MAG: hypothetical protein KJZ87_19675, partial [Thermoguttaceae bacterium]|nr:hypothetical protein [Thermoguttaceae bacterium]
SAMQPLWIEIEIPRTAAAGEYKGMLSVSWEGGEASLPMRLIVWHFELPAERHQQVTSSFTFPGAGYRVAHDSPAFWELAAKYAKISVAHRHTCFKAELGWIKIGFDPRQRPLELCRRVATTLHACTREADVLLATRRQIAREIESLGASPLLYVQTEPCKRTVVPAGPRLINVCGITEPSATVKINGRPVADVKANGVFASTCFLSKPEVTIEAARDDKVHTVTRTFQLVD